MRVSFPRFFLPTNKAQRHRFIVRCVGVAYCLVVMLAATIYVSFHNDDDDGGEAAKQPQAAISSVPGDALAQLDQGTVLRFGNTSHSVPIISLVVDPELLSRSGPLFGPSPDPALLAIQQERLGLNLYLVASNPSRAAGVESLLKAAVCRLGNDVSPGKFDTLLGLVDAADHFQGTEDVVQAAQIMRSNPQAQCVGETAAAASDTSDNGLHFMSRLQLSSPRALISEGMLFNDFSVLAKDWGSRVASGHPAYISTSGVK